MAALRVQDADAANAAEGGAAGANEFEVDPNEDPELLMVLRMSLQEAQQQQQQSATAAAGAGSAGGGSGERRLSAVRGRASLQGPSLWGGWSRSRRTGG